MKKRVIVLPHNHFDLIWRRRFDGTSRLGNVALASYAEIEEAVIDRWLDLGQAFTEGQAAVLRKYLERNPGRAEQVRQLVKEGRICVPMAGETVQDNNMPAPEGLIRNFSAALPFYQDIGAGDDLNLIWIEDSFGSNPNYPQILRGVGADAVCKFFYISPQTELWTGIDGSSLAIIDRFYDRIGCGSFEKHPYCTACNGHGCDQCDNGTVFVPPRGEEKMREAFERAVSRMNEKGGDFCAVEVGGEELLPEAGLAAMMDEMRAKYPDIEFVYGTTGDVYRLVKERIDAALAAGGEISPDLNPVFSGCYVSRIKLKQKCRSLAYALLAIESDMARAAWDGGTAAGVNDIKDAWRTLVFVQFHDAITGSVIDNGYEELVDMLAAVEKITDKYARKTAAPPAPAVPGAYNGADTVVWGDNTVIFDDCGVKDIITNDQRLFAEKPYSRVRRPFRIGELCIEQDAGDAWSTKVMPQFSPDNNWSMVQLGDFQRVEHAGPDRIVWRGVYGGADYMVRKLDWTVTLSPGAGGCLDFRADIDWDTDSRRIKALFPIDSREDSAVWEVPFGHISRKYDPGKLNYGAWMSDTQEFPAQNFVLRTVGQNGGVALLNRGLPCHRWYLGCLEMSLLRSPQCGFCINEQGQYDFFDLSGLRDQGRHGFDFALLPYTDGRGVGDVARAAHAYNQVDALNLAFTVSGGAIVTAFKITDDGAGFVLRFYDPSGEGCAVEIDWGKTVTVRECDLLERPAGEAVTCEKSEYELGKFKIKTLYIKK